MIIKNGFTLGILGGGQLGRMSALAAARLGINVIIYCPEKNAPASQVSCETIIAQYDDLKALEDFSNKCDAITYEFENIPVNTIDYLNNLKQENVFPDKYLLYVSQERLKEKEFLNNLGINTTRWSAISNIEDIKNTLKSWNKDEFILKTTRFGYDGKGQIKSDRTELENNNNELLAFLTSTKDQGLIMEEPVDFICEISVIIARDKLGKTATYDTMLNQHKNHILHKTTVPSGISQNSEIKARDVAKSIAEKINLIGVLTVEFFVLANSEVLVNEIAPRTHNSGHWSIDACSVSQFENHVRCVCSLPVGSSKRHNDATMLNLIGDEINQIDKHINDDNSCIHLYGKREVRAGRKMGHITFLKPLSHLK